MKGRNFNTLMQNLIDFLEENNDKIHFQVYHNILCNDDWVIIDYHIPLDELTDFENQIVTKAIERKLKNNALN